MCLCLSEWIISPPIVERNWCRQASGSVVFLRDGSISKTKYWSLLLAGCIHSCTVTVSSCPLWGQFMSSSLLGEDICSDLEFAAIPSIMAEEVWWQVQGASWLHYIHRQEEGSKKRWYSGNAVQDPIPGNSDMGGLCTSIKRIWIIPYRFIQSFFFQ